MANDTLITSTKVLAAATHAAVTADVNGTGVDMSGFGQALIFVKLGTTTGTGAETVNILAQESESSGSGYATVTTSSTVALTGGVGTGATFAVQVQCTKRYLRYVINVTGTTPSAGDCVAVILGGSGSLSLAASAYTVTA